MFSRGKLMNAAGAALLSGTMILPSSTIHASPSPDPAIPAAAAPRILLPALPPVAVQPNAPAEMPASAAADAAEAADPAPEAVAEREAAPPVSPTELACMTKVILYEAGSEVRDGQIAVAQVVMNRVKSPRFPNSVCGVIHQRGQFSSIRSFRHPRNARWQRAEAIARDVIEGDHAPVVGRALYFHAARVRPAYVASRTKVGRVGNHLFYR